MFTKTYAALHHSIIRLCIIPGWWQYDDRTSQDIEEAFLLKEKTSSILVAGCLYLVDFEAMTQLRQDDHSRRRRVKRDLGSIQKKGVAGLRLDSNNTVVTDITPTTSTESVLTGVGGGDVVTLATTQNAPSTTDSALRIATHIIDSTLAHSDDYQSSDETGRDVSQEIFDDSDLLEGIRNLTLRNMVDSSESENEDENIFSR